MPSLKASLILTLLSTNGATVVLFGVTIVLARLLSPEEIGIYSITAVLIAIAHFFRDFGVSSYLQQEKEITREKVAAAYGVMLTSSWLIAALTYLAAPWAAGYYGQPGIQNVMEVLALGYVFIPFGAVTHSLLTRDYRAKEQAYVRVYGTAAYALSAIGLAQLGFSYMAMPWANFVNIIVTALAYARYTPDIAKCWPSIRGWKQVTNFGAAATLGSSLNAINNAIPDLVLGKISGPHAVGVVSRSMSTTQLVNQVLGPTISYAVLPYFSRTHHAGESLAAVLTKGCAYLTGIMWPATLCTAVLALPLTTLLYGDRWLECAPLIQIICFMLFLTVPFNFLSTAFMAIGRPHIASIPTLLTIALRGFFIWLVYDGSTQSFVWGLVAASLVMYPLSGALQKRVFGVSWRDFMGAQSKSLVVTLACCAVASTSLLLPADTPAVLVVLGAGLVMPFVWLFSLRWTGHALWAEVVDLVNKKPKLATTLANLKLI